MCEMMYLCYVSISVAHTTERERESESERDTDRQTETETERERYYRLLITDIGRPILLPVKKKILIIK